MPFQIHALANDKEKEIGVKTGEGRPRGTQPRLMKPGGGAYSIPLYSHPLRGLTGMCIPTAKVTPLLILREMRLPIRASVGRSNQGI
jgi:hypothetical protein